MRNIWSHIVTFYRSTQHFLVGGLMLAVFVISVSFADRYSKQSACRGIRITFHPAGECRFLSEAELQNLVYDAAGGNVIGRKKPELNLKDIEEALDKNNFIQKAEVYLELNDTLCLDVFYRNPVIRISSVTNGDYYLDENGEAMPLSSNHTARILIASGYITNSLLFPGERYLFEMSKIINADPFLKSLIGQIYVNEAKEQDKTFILIPRAGKLQVEIGDGEDLPAKFTRLKIFYKKVFPTLDLAKYTTVNLEYKDQIILK